MRVSARLAAGVLLAPLVLAASAVRAPAHAEPVQLRHEGRTLNAELVMPPGRAMRDGLVILVHGTLMHGRMELMSALQTHLAARRIGSLAITLSLGLDDRRGPYDCAIPHRHMLDQTAAEIRAWMRWAEERGASRIILAGHSRGGAQVAYAVATRAAPDVRRVVLIAPTTFDADEVAAAYEARFGTPLPARIAEATQLADTPGAVLAKVGFLHCSEASVAPRTFLDTYTGAERHDTPTLLPRIEVPTLVVIAGSDEVVPGLDRRIAEVPGRLRVATIEGADHQFRDLFGEDLADVMRPFVRE